MTTLTVPPLPSEKKFGITLALALGTYGSLRTWSLHINVLCLLLSIALGVSSIAAPRLLAPLNRTWFRLGQLLGRIVNPIVLGLIYFGVLTPFGLIARLAGRDELRLRRTALGSYWLSRKATRLTVESFKHQF
jgi:hypothetical protein